MQLLRHRVPVAILVSRFYGFHHDAYGRAAHGFKRLANSGERRHGEAGDGDIIETDYRTLFWNSDAGLCQGADRAERREVVESQQCGELLFLLQELFSQAVA